MVLHAVTIPGGDWDHAKGFMYFFDGETYEIIKKLELPDVTGRVSVTDARQFEDGTYYVVLMRSASLRLIARRLM